MSLFRDDDDVCAHPGCTCEPFKGSKYCSAYCEDSGDHIVETACACGHQGCGPITLRPDEGELMPQPA
jgi:hypothetical protein